MSELLNQFNLAKQATDGFRSRWDDFLEIAYAKIPEAKGFKSRVATGDLSNLIIERNARVAARVPTGKIIPLSKHDEAKALVVNLGWKHHVLEKANWGYPMPIKLRMWDFYSLVYGIMPMFHGYNFSEEYTGPDCRLVDIRFVSPQAGRNTPNDCDYVFYETFHSKSELKDMKGRKGWNSENLDELLNSKPDPEVSDQATTMQHARGEADNLNAGMYKLITKYVRGKGKKWTTFDTKGNTIREIENPFESGRIPIVFKIAFPLVDSFWGLGDVERGESLQKAIHTITNLSIDYLKTVIFPPITMASDMNPSQYPFKPAAKWRIDKTRGEFIEPAQLNQAPANVSSQLNQSFKASLLNQNGTTDTTISASDGAPGFGKTHKALQTLSERQNSRDNFDRQMFESACKELFEGMLEELGTVNTLPVEFDIFEQSVEELDPIQNVDGVTVTTLGKDYARVKVTPDFFKGRQSFRLDIGSSAENDEKEEFERVETVIEMLQSPFGQKASEVLAAQGKEIDYELILEQFLSAANIKNRDQVIRPLTTPQEIDSESDIAEDFNPDMIEDPILKQAMLGGY